MALTAERATSAVRMLRIMRDDIAHDMRVLEGAPFTGPVVAEAFGQLAAQVDALAHVLIEHLDDEGAER